MSNRKTGAVVAGLALLCGGVLWWAYEPVTPEATTTDVPTGAPERAVARTPAAAAEGGPAVVVAEPTPDADPDPEDPLAPPSHCATSVMRDDECSFVDPDEDTLREMARCAIVRGEGLTLPTPDDADSDFSAEWVERAGLTEAEHEVLRGVAYEFGSKARAAAADIAVAGGAERGWAESATLATIVDRLVADADPTEADEAYAAIANERAGLQEPPAETGSEVEQVLRLRAGLGDAFEAAVAQKLGDTRARELRLAADGWPGHRRLLSNRCTQDTTADEPFVPTTREQAKQCVVDRKGNGCRFHDPTDLELEEMARCGIIRFDAPEFLGARGREPTFGQGWRAKAGISDSDAEALLAVNDAFRDEFYADLTALALEAGMTQEWADQTPFIGMMVAINDSVGPTPEQTEEFYRTLARERAGQVAPPTDLSGLSLDERFLRRVLDVGQAYERALAEQLGPERAAELHALGDGWADHGQTRDYCASER